jgi:hypothetical protein
VFFRDEAKKTYANVCYTKDDDRRPLIKGEHGQSERRRNQHLPLLPLTRKHTNAGRVRMTNYFAFVVKEVPGSKGKASDCWRLNLTDPGFRTGLGMLNKWGSSKASSLNALPLVELKRNVALLLKDYEESLPLPPLAEVVHRGVDLTKYVMTEINQLDRAKVGEGLELLETYWRDRMNPNKVSPRESTRAPVRDRSPNGTQPNPTQPNPTTPPRPSALEAAAEG